MAKIKVSITDPTPETGRAQPTPGLYRGKVNKIEQKTSKSGNPMLEVTLKVTNNSGPQKEFKGATLRTWIVLSEEAEWKLKEFLLAVGVKLKKGSVSFDPDALVGTEIQFKVDASEYNGNYSAAVGTLMAMPSADEDEDDDDPDPDEDEDDAEDESGDDDEADDDDDDEEAESDDDGFDEWSIADLKEQAKEYGLPTALKNKKGVKLTGDKLKAALITSLREYDADDDDPFDDE